MNTINSLEFEAIQQAYMNADLSENVLGMVAGEIPRPQMVDTKAKIMQMLGIEFMAQAHEFLHQMLNKCHAHNRKALDITSEEISKVNDLFKLCQSRGFIKESINEDGEEEEEEETPAAPADDTEGEVNGDTEDDAEDDETPADDSEEDSEEETDDAETVEPDGEVPAEEEPANDDTDADLSLDGDDEDDIETDDADLEVPADSDDEEEDLLDAEKEVLATEAKDDEKESDDEESDDEDDAEDEEDEETPSPAPADDEETDDTEDDESTSDVDKAEADAVANADLKRKYSTAFLSALRKIKIKSLNKATPEQRSKFWSILAKIWTVDGMAGPVPFSFLNDKEQEKLNRGIGL